MRLLKINDDDEVSIVTFSREIPAYAILSHTWGSDDDEVTLKDIVEGVGSGKPGFRKIVFCGDQARSHSLAYFWVDTCCIDKSSSAELSESINSMFQWYQKAEICYAYLSDVGDPGDGRDIVDQVRTSRWFTRGWTLQELLAPPKLKFFDRDWNFIGDKLDLCPLIQEITKVNFGALNWSWTLPSYSIATRMSWVSNRITTRVEDHAYCMLGILGVHMPLLYGEGDNAFRRLQEELIKNSDDETIFAHSGRHIVASSPREFSSGLDLTVLNKSESTPYSITNTGLHIRMRVLEHPAEHGIGPDQEVTALGILNCHHNEDSTRDGYLALPLQLTSRKNTYRRVPSALRFVDADLANSAEYRTIFVQLKPVQISRITLLEDWDQASIHVEGISAGSDIAGNPSKRELRIYPTSPFEQESVCHRFRLLKSGSRSSTPFHVVTFFDLVKDKSDDDDDAFDYEAAFESWKNQGRPTDGEFIPAFNANSGDRIRITITQAKNMKQFVWFLRLETQQT
jgi:hypothetical protein